MIDDDENLEIDPALHVEESVPPSESSESWQQELPPEDDFHDHEEVETMISEDQEIETGIEEEPPPPPKKSGAPALLGSLAILALILGGLAYSQFSGGSSKKTLPSTPIQTMPRVTDKQPSGSSAFIDHNVGGNSESGISGLKPAPTTNEADISDIYKSGMSKTTSHSSNAVAVPGDSTPDHNANKTGVGQLGMSDIFGSDADKFAPIQGGNNAKKDAPPAGLGSSVQGNVSAEVEDQLKDLASQVKDLKETVEKTAKKASQLDARIDSNKTEPSSDKVAVLENRLDQIEQKLAQITSSKSARIAAKESVQGDAETENAPYVEPVKKVVRKRNNVIRKSVRKKSSRAANVAKASPKKADRWVLRAATPEAAWVAKSSGSSELKKVQVGDDLPGVGEIRSIEQTGDSWAVIGSEGEIH